MTHNSQGLRVRTADGKPAPQNLEVGAYGELFIDDGTGFVSGSDAAAEIIDDSPLKVSRLFHVSAVAAERAASTDGRLTVQLPGDYLIYASGRVALEGASDTAHIEVYKNAAVMADAAATPGGEISAFVTSVGATTEGWSLIGIAPDCNVGDYFDLRITTAGSSTGTIKQMRFGIRQIGDMADALNPST